MGGENHNCLALIISSLILGYSFASPFCTRKHTWMSQKDICTIINLNMKPVAYANKYFTRIWNLTLIKNAMFEPHKVCTNLSTERGHTTLDSVHMAMLNSLRTNQLRFTTLPIQNQRGRKIMVLYERQYKLGILWTKIYAESHLLRMIVAHLINKISFYKNSKHIIAFPIASHWTELRTTSSWPIYLRSLLIS